MQRRIGVLLSASWKVESVNREVISGLATARPEQGFIGSVVLLKSNQIE